MERTHRRRPSAALLVAFLALLVALGGTAGADTVASVARTIKGKTIRKGSVPGNRLAKNSVTGTQVKESKLGKVPSAKAADTAKTATTATTATSAVTAQSATTAASATSAASADVAKSVTGVFKLPLKRAAPTDGASQAAARDAAPRVPLGTVGPYTFYGKCYRDTSGPDLYSAVFVSTSVAGVVADGDNIVGGLIGPDTAEVDTTLDETDAATNDLAFEGEGDSEFTLIAPDGQTLMGDEAVGARQGTVAGGDGAFGAGDGCIFVMRGELNPS